MREVLPEVGLVHLLAAERSVRLVAVPELHLTVDTDAGAFLALGALRVAAENLSLSLIGAV